MRRGITLIEVMLVTAIFAGMLAVFVLIQRQGEAVGSKSQASDRAFRAVTLGLADIQQELTNARLVATVPGALFSYSLPRLDAGRVVLDPQGLVVWTAGDYSLVVNQGRLLRTHPTLGNRVYCDLGQGGANATVQANQLVKVTLHAEFDPLDPKKHSDYTVTSTFLVAP